MSLSVIGVVGAGFMGSGIAATVAAAGPNVVVYDLDRAALERSRETVAGSLRQRITRSRIRREEAERLIGRIRTPQGRTLTAVAA